MSPGLICEFTAWITSITKTEDTESMQLHDDGICDSRIEVYAGELGVLEPGRKVRVTISVEPAVIEEHGQDEQNDDGEKLREFFEKKSFCIQSDENSTEIVKIIIGDKVFLPEQNEDGLPVPPISETAPGAP